MVVPDLAAGLREADLRGADRRAEAAAADRWVVEELLGVPVAGQEDSPNFR
jgi:hypothetical protein